MDTSDNPGGLILAVDDNISNLELLDRMLSRKGHEVHTVSSGDAALESVRVRTPDLILLDISMPGLSGFDVCRILKENRKTRSIPIIFISALTDLDSKIEAFRSGGVDYITKPFQSKEVLARVNTHLALQHMQKELALGKKLLEATGNAISDLVILTDERGIITRCNLAALKSLHVHMDEVIGKHYADFFGETIGIDLGDAGSEDGISSIMQKEVYLERACGWFEIASNPVYIQDKLAGNVFTLKDVSVYKEAAERERSAREFAEALHEADVVINSSLNIDEVLEHILDQIQRVIPHTSANIMSVEQKTARIIRMKGYEKYGEEACRRAAEAIFRVDETPNLKEMVRSGQAVIISDTNRSEVWDAEKTASDIRSWLGAPIIASSRVIALIGLDHTTPNFYTPEHAERLTIFAAQASMALENAQLFEEMNKMATVDFLTGLYNRRYFFTLAEREVQRAKETGSVTSLILLDLDHLKEINTRYGHIVGGQSLQAVGELCRNTLPPHLIAAVYGGDEFAILLPDTTPERAYEIAEEFRKVVEEAPIETYRGEIHITITSGVAGMPGDQNLTLETLIDRADMALFSAKDGGRNRSLLWSETVKVLS